MQVTIRDGNRASYDVDLTAFHKEVISFGRQDDNDIVLKSEFVSRVHGVFYAEGANFYVEDLDSTNGLRFKGERIKRHAMENGDVIVIQGTSGREGDCVEIRYRKKELSGNIPIQPMPQPVQIVQPVYYAPIGMGWYNYIIWVQLFLHMIFTVYWFVRYVDFVDLTDDYKHFGLYTSDFFDSLTTNSCIFLFLCVVYIAACISVRMELATYKRKAPTHYAILVNFGFGIALFRLFAIDLYLWNPYLYVDGYSISAEGLLEILLYACIVEVYVLANKSYFDRRKNMFIY